MDQNITTVMTYDGRCMDVNHILTSREDIIISGTRRKIYFTFRVNRRTAMKTAKKPAKISGKTSL